jgi:hypothetical protein
MVGQIRPALRPKPKARRGLRIYAHRYEFGPIAKPG